MKRIFDKENKITYGGILLDMIFFLIIEILFVLVMEAL